MTVRSASLRIVIAADAAACGLAGVGLALDAGLLAGPVGLPATLLQPLGEGLIAYALLLAWLASRPSLRRWGVWALVALNVVWAVESATAPLLGWAHPTDLGLIVLLAQAAGALLVAELQFLALRRAGRDALA